MTVFKDMILPWILMGGSLYFGFFTKNPPSPFWDLPTGIVLWLLSMGTFILVMILNRTPIKKEKPE